MRYRDPYDDRPKRRDDEDRERPSWRDIDSRRNRSAHVSQDRPEKMPSNMAQRGESLAKKALEDLFQPKKSKEELGAWKKVIESKGRDFSKKAKAYIDKYGMPREWDDLLRLLDHDDAKVLEQILDSMLELAPNETPVRRDLLQGKVRVLKMTAEEPALISKLEKMHTQLSEMDA